MIGAVTTKQRRQRYLAACRGKPFFGCLLPVQLRLFGKNGGCFFAGPTLAVDANGERAVAAGHANPEELAAFLALTGRHWLLTDGPAPAGWRVGGTLHLFGLEPGSQLPLPPLPAGFVRWLLLIAAFLIGGALSAVILHAPSAYYQGKKLFVALAALAAVALLTLAQFGEGLLAVLLVIVCLVLLGLLTLHGGRRTAFGDEIVTQAMSYRRFLRRVTQSQLLSRLAQDSQYFYRILPYAEAIGLGAGLARTLGNTELEQCDWYQEQQPLPRTAAGFYSHLQEALALLELSIRK